MTAIPTARALTTALIQHEVSQTGHGFDVGDIVIDDIFGGPPNWVLAQADTVGNCFCSMMVSSIINVDRFVVTQVGFVQNVTSQVYTAGGDYYLSPTIAGDLTVVAPTTGQVYLPCFKAETSNSGFFFGGSGILLSGSSAFPWTVEGAGPVSMAVNNGYMTASGGTIILNLPAVAAIGDIIRITNLSGNFQVVCGGGQDIQFGNDLATTSITSTAVGDSLEIICFNANVGFQVLSSMGNLTFV